MTLIQEIVTANTQASVIFLAVPQIYRDLTIVVRGRGTLAANTSDILLQFNQDSTATYFRQVLDASGTQVLATATATNNGCDIGGISGASATANYSGVVRATIFNYRDTVFFKTYISQGGANFSSPAGQDAQIASGMWASTAAIDHIVVKPGSGSFVDGSVVSLYGLD